MSTPRRTDAGAAGQPSRPCLGSSQAERPLLRAIDLDSCGVDVSGALSCLGKAG
jgi:hypothetical protein